MKNYSFYDEIESSKSPDRILHDLFHARIIGNNYRFSIKSDLVLDKIISIITTNSSNSFGIRRNNKDIREDRRGGRLLVFCRSGQVKVVRSDKTILVSRSQAGIVDLNETFYVKFDPGVDKYTQAIMMVVPDYLFTKHCSSIDGMKCLTLSEGVVHQLNPFLDILSSGQELVDRVVGVVVSGFLDCMAELSAAGLDVHMPPSRKELRINQIKKIIMDNISDPELTFNKVAKTCELSEGYVCRLLGEHGTTFSDLLWNERLSLARERLRSSSMQRHAINEIAFRSGFKSAAHFSRKFKEAYGCSPRGYRLEATLSD